MKISITGGSSGIGKGIFDVLTENNIETFSFNKTKGYNIDDIDDRKKIINNIIENKSKIFINNAYGQEPFSQMYMLNELCGRLSETSITHIINLNSVNYNNNTPRGIPQSKYAISKNALLMCSQHMRHLYGVYVTDIILGLTDTEYNKDKKLPKLSIKEVGEQIYNIIKADFKVNYITIMK